MRINTYVYAHPIIFDSRVRGKEVRPVCSCPWSNIGPSTRALPGLISILKQRKCQWKSHAFPYLILSHRHVEAGCPRASLASVLFFQVHNHPALGIPFIAPQFFPWIYRVSWRGEKLARLFS